MHPLSDPKPKIQIPNQMTDILGLIFELIFLGLGIFLYIFALGRFTPGDADTQKKANDFRQKNGWWLRMTALALIAIMLVNLYLHLQVYIGN
ncbi:MAG: hypothetical protein DHS20C18_10070 [Saprospiraceae bacterium]|nr:MAG: hypothetical protein DHS20C18_10070 [Saprospiraceae bacterium]